MSHWARFALRASVYVHYSSRRNSCNHTSNDDGTGMTPLHETMHKGVGTVRYYPHAARAPYFVFVRSYFAETGLRACFVDVWNMS